MAAVPNSIRFLSDLSGRFSIFHTPFLDPMYHGGVDPMLDSGNCFDFDPAGNKVVKATGGLITLVNKNSASLTNCSFEDIIPGRATRLAILAWGKVSVTFNVRNERLTPAQFLCLENRIQLDLAEAKANPHRFSINLVGDLSVPLARTNGSLTPLLPMALLLLCLLCCTPTDLFITDGQISSPN